MSQDLTELFCDKIKSAAQNGQTLRLCGTGSKARFGKPGPADHALSTLEHSGIVRHEPSELFVTVRSGTSLQTLEQSLAQAQQILPFDPPQFGDSGTIGGAIASGLSGPARPWRGAARDLVLGVKMINGRGQSLRFGGEVMKNVAGYDVSRLLCGAYGRLGLLLEVSLKLLPAPEYECTQVLDVTSEQARTHFLKWAQQPWPLSGMSYHRGRAYVRLSGAEAGVKDACAHIGGETLTNCPLWTQWRDHKDPFFTDGQPVWRLSLPFASEWPEHAGDDMLSEWGGAQLWLKSSDAPEHIIEKAKQLGGHARLITPTGTATSQTPLPCNIAELQRAINHAFDPNGVFAPQSPEV